MRDRISYMLDALANRLEAQGFIKEAYEIDKVTDELGQGITKEEIDLINESGLLGPDENRKTEQDIIRLGQSEVIETRKVRFMKDPSKRTWSAEFGYKLNYYAPPTSDLKHLFEVIKGKVPGEIQPAHSDPFSRPAPFVTKSPSKPPVGTKSMYMP